MRCPAPAGLQTWGPLCRKNFNFLFKMNGIWAEATELHLICSKTSADQVIWWCAPLNPLVCRPDDLSAGKTSTFFSRWSVCGLNLPLNLQEKLQLSFQDEGYVGWTCRTSPPSEPAELHLPLQEKLQLSFSRWSVCEPAEAQFKLLGSSSSRRFERKFLYLYIDFFADVRTYGSNLTQWPHLMVANATLTATPSMACLQKLMVQTWLNDTQRDITRLTVSHIISRCHAPTQIYSRPKSGN